MNGLPPTVRTSASGKTILDFGQNLAGWVEFTVQAKAGQRVKMRFGELLDENGEMTLKNIQCSSKKKTTPLQRSEFVCKEGENHYKNTFSVFGFQYAELTTDAVWQPQDFAAIAVYSDLERTGWFASSNPLLDRLVEATVWSAKGNSLDVPTDCPTRERHGWTGDAQVFFNTAGILFGYAPFAHKYLNDMYDWQKPDGKLPQIVPCGGVNPYMAPLDGSVGWADAGILIPYRFWKLYGDDSLLRTHYDGMMRYARFMMGRCGKFTPLRRPQHLKDPGKPYLVNFGQSYGEWAEPAEVYPNDWTNMVLPHPEESTAYTAYVLGLMAEAADHLHKPEDAALCRRYQTGCTKAYQELVTLPGHTLDTDRQAKLVRPLYMGLLDESQTQFARARLVQAMEQYRWRLGTGFLSTPFILDVLADIDIACAYRLLENEEIPGWLSMPRQGATTIWESWEDPNAQGGIGSLNHYSKGAVCEWLFTAMCGIRPDPEAQNRFVIAPRPGGRFTHACARWQSPWGVLESGWEKAGEGWRFTVTVPANTTAAVLLPDGSRHEAGPGTHHF